MALALTACIPTMSKDTATPADAVAGTADRSGSQRPFVVNWAPTDRTALETRAQEGPVIVAARDGEVALLPRCRVAGEYRYAGASHASQSLVIDNEVDLGLKFPFAGPVNLGAKLDLHGQLVVEYHTIGEYKLDLDAVAAEQLQGDCAGASHVVSSLSVGAFEFFAGQRVGARVDASVPATVGAGGGGEHSRENLDRGGDKEACATASKKDLEPVERCDSILAIELVPIERELPLVGGEVWEGDYECAGTKTRSTLEIVEVAHERDVVARLSFDDGKEQGTFLAEGRYDAGTGALRLDFSKWETQPAGYVPVTPVGTISVEGNVFEGAMQERACPHFEYRRR